MIYIVITLYTIILYLIIKVIVSRKKPQLPTEELVLIADKIGEINKKLLEARNEIADYQKRRLGSITNQMGKYIRTSPKSTTIIGVDFKERKVVHRTKYDSTQTWA